MTKSTHRDPPTTILLANDLLLGEVVFWTGFAWSRDARDAAIANGETEADSFAAAARASVAGGVVVDAELVPVSNRDAEGNPQPAHFRDAIRLKGPTHRPDLGKQAEFGTR